MMKPIIKIYGDSFANFNLDIDNSKTWIDSLTDEFEVVNFAEKGSSIYHSYKILESDPDDTYYSIFVIPEPSRFKSYHLEQLIPEEFETGDYWYTNYPTVLHTEELMKKRQVDSDRIMSVLQSLKNYYEIWKDHEYYADLNRLAIFYLKQKQQNILFINTHPYENQIGLVDLSLWELEQLGYTEKLAEIRQVGNISVYRNDVRKNHLSEDNNIILGDKILQAIHNNQQELIINIEDFVVPSKSISSYVRWEKI